MKHFVAAVLAALATAAPLAPRAVTDADILQFALTLEHLENVFYKQAIAKFSAKDFYNAGYDDFYYRNLKFIGADEQSHVDALTAGLKAAGAKPVAACEYNFQFTDVKSFIGLSAVLEGVGTSAYLGAAPLVQDKGYLTVAGSILVTEAKHTSLQRYVTRKIAPDNAYGTPLGANEVYTLAAAFIKSCPPGNSPLPFKAFPSLTAEIGNLPQVGQTHITKFSTKAKNTPSTAYLTFVNGLSIISVKATKASDGTYSAAVPEAVEGQSYVILTKSDAKGAAPADSDVIAGPAILEVCSNIETTSKGYPNGPN